MVVRGKTNTKKEWQASESNLHVSQESKVHKEARFGYESLIVKTQRLTNKQGYLCEGPDVKGNEEAYGREKKKGQLREVSHKRPHR